jgi:hypothetical protein
MRYEVRCCRRTECRLIHLRNQANKGRAKQLNTVSHGAPVEGTYHYGIPMSDMVRTLMRPYKYTPILLGESKACAKEAVGAEAGTERVVLVMMASSGRRFNLTCRRKLILKERS